MSSPRFIRRSRLIVTFLLLLIVKNNAQDILINEFLASNSVQYKYLPDKFEFPDWIEIYNNTDVSVNMGQYFISDSRNDLKKWRFPDTLLKAKEYMLLIADGDDNNGSLSFKLSRGGEWIIISDANGNIEDSIKFGLQERNISMGRNINDLANWSYFYDPTPGFANTTYAVTEIAYSDKPTFSIKGGAFSSNIVLELDATEGGDIYYSTDGSSPTHSSIKYSGKITIDTTTVIKAIQVASGKLPSRINTHTYFINENHVLPLVSLSVDPLLFYESMDGIYIVDRPKDYEIPATIEFYEEDKSFKNDAGIRISGEASALLEQKPFTLKADEKFGEDAFNYKLFPNKQTTSFEELYLRNGGYPDYAFTRIRDALMHSLVINEIDIDCQDYKPAVVYINGVYWGLYNFREKLNENYFFSNRGADPNMLDIIEPHSIKAGSRDDYSNLLNYIAENDINQTIHYEHVKNRIDVNELSNYLITQLFYANCDWVTNNTMWWREQKSSSKWRWVLQDMDAGFGYSTGLIYCDSPPETDLFDWLNRGDGFFSKILTNQEFSSEFYGKFNLYLNTLFTTPRLLSYITRMQKEIEPEIERYVEKFGGEGDGSFYGIKLKDYGTWKENIEAMKDFAVRRPAIIQNQLISKSLANGTSLLTLNYDSTKGKIKIHDIVLNSNFSGTFCNNIEYIVEAEPEPGFDFIEWRGTVTSNSNTLLIRTNQDHTIAAIFEQNASSVLPNEINTDTRLTPAGSPYYTSGELIIEKGTSVIVEAGTEILVKESSSIIVNGNLTIEGSDASPVIIKAGGSENNLWGCIYFENAEGNNKISNAIIKNATNGDDRDRQIGAISSYKSNISLDNVTVKAAFPVFIQYGNAYINRSTLRSDFTCDMVNVKYADSAIVENCVFEGNNAFDTDAIDYDGIKNGIIRNNKIFNFLGSNSDGIDLGEDCVEVLIEGNRIYNCFDKGISIGQNSKAIVKRNLIVGCGQGIAVKDKGSYALVINNTFYSNDYAVASFEKNLGMGGGSIKVVNCILSSSKTSPYFLDDLSELQFTYTLSDQELLDGNGNIFALPKFHNNLYLSAVSPAIDKGDPQQETDPDGSVSDLGCFAYDETINYPLIFNEVLFSTKNGNKEFIEIRNLSDSRIDVNGYVISGVNEFIFPQGSFIEPQGYLIICNNPESFSLPPNKVFKWENTLVNNEYFSLYLQNRNKEIVDEFHYYKVDHLDLSKYALNLSIELEVKGSENLALSNWQLSKIVGGSPGTDNSRNIFTGIVINELQASNTTTIKDEFGNYSDWIELYNTTTDTIDIFGMFISDNLDIPTKYKIGIDETLNTKIAPGKHLLLWADGRPELGNLHLNFKIKSSDQVLIASQHEGDTTIVDMVSFDDLNPNFSFGRTKDGSNNWKKFRLPTPGVANSLDNVFTEGILLINGLKLSNSQAKEAYENKAFWGDYDFSFWDYYPNNSENYPTTLPEPVGTAETDLSVLLKYSSIICIFTKIGTNLQYWNQSNFLDYVKYGGNVFLMSRAASNFITPNFQEEFGVEWEIPANATINSFVSNYDGLSDLNLNGNQNFNSILSSTIDKPNTTVIYKDTTYAEKPANVGILYQPEYGGYYKENGGNFVLINGTPYRCDYSDLRTNIEFILENFFNESKPVSVEEQITITEYNIEQNYPNPFNPYTNIRYQLKEKSKVSIVLYNMLGQRVQNLVSSVQPAGVYKLRVDGNKLASGVYFYDVYFNPTSNGGKEYRATKKMLLVK